MPENLSNIFEQRKLLRFIPFGKERRLAVHEKVCLGLSVFGVLKILEVIGNNSIVILSEKSREKVKQEVIGGLQLVYTPYFHGFIYSRKFTSKNK